MSFDTIYTNTIKTKTGNELIISGDPTGTLKIASTDAAIAIICGTVENQAVSIRNSSNEDSIEITADGLQIQSANTFGTNGDVLTSNGTYALWDGGALEARIRALELFAGIGIGSMSIEKKITSETTNKTK